MPLYELFSSVRARMSPHELSDLLKKTAFIVLDNHGVVRKIENLGIEKLGYHIVAHATKFKDARHVVMQFDARPSLALELSRQLRIDDRIIRHTIFKRTRSELLTAKKMEQPVERSFVEKELPVLGASAHIKAEEREITRRIVQTLDVIKQTEDELTDANLLSKRFNVPVAVVQQALPALASVQAKVRVLNAEILQSFIGDIDVEENYGKLLQETRQIALITAEDIIRDFMKKDQPEK